MLLPFRTHPVAFFLFGFTWACVSAQSALDDRLAPRLEAQTRWLEGRVSGLPEQAGGVVRFELEDAQARRERLPRRMRLAWREGPALKSGERWRLAVKLRQPMGLLNPQGFDYQAWLLARRIGATGTVKAGQLLAPAPQAWRQGLRQRLLEVEAQGARCGAGGAGDGRRFRPDAARLAAVAGHRHRPPDGDFRAAHQPAGWGDLFAVAGLARHGLWPERLP